MLSLILALAPLCPAQTPAPDPARAKATVVELEKALKEGAPADRVIAVQAAAQVLDSEVIGRIAKGMRDKEVDVERAAIEALRFMHHPDATKALVDAAKREPRLKKYAELYALLVRAIGQHADASTIEVLTDDIWNTPEYPVIRARIPALGRIRGKASVEKLVDLMRLGGPGKVEPYMEFFRIALMVQTGADQGTSLQGWLEWWNANKTKLVMAEKPVPLPKTSQYLWDAYWGENRL